MSKALEGVLVVFLILGALGPIYAGNPNYELKMDKTTKERVLSGSPHIDVIVELYQLNDSSIGLFPKEKILAQYEELNSIHVILTADELKNISLSSYVKNIWFNAKGLDIYDATPFSSKDQIVVNSYMGADTIRASSIYPLGYKGNGITVAILDTGIRGSHVEFPEGKILYQYDFINNDPIAEDTVGHGTFVSGIVSGGAYTTADWKGVVDYIDTTLTNTTGVAPDTKLVVLKVVPGDLSIFLSACNWIMLNKEKYNIRVVNMSAGWDPNVMKDNGWPLDGTDPASLAANAVVDRGIVWVSSAGNKGPGLDTIGAPGRAKNVITVANAVDRNLASNGIVVITKVPLSIANDSSRGGGEAGFKPDISAPGTNILSSWNASDDSYIISSGTSMAAPFVSGACAILIQRHQNWTPYQVKIAIMRTATPIPNATIYEQGAGMINLQKAFSYRQDFEKASVIPKILAIIKKNKENN